jgi:hypothetical protein
MVMAHRPRSLITTTSIMMTLEFEDNIDLIKTTKD